MRNPKRIPELMTILTKIWESQPDTRFNQLIYNLQREYKDGYFLIKAQVNEGSWGIREVTYPDLFNVEDADFMNFLVKKLEKINKNQK